MEAHSHHCKWQDQTVYVASRDGAISVVLKCEFWKSHACRMQLKLIHACRPLEDGELKLRLVSRGSHASHRREAAVLVKTSRGPKKVRF